MAKNWFSISFESSAAGGNRDEEVMGRLCAFVNKHHLQPDDFKIVGPIALSHVFECKSHSSVLVGVRIIYYAEQELKP